MVVEHSLLCLCRREYNWGKRGILRSHVTDTSQVLPKSLGRFLTQNQPFFFFLSPERAILVHKFQTTLEISVLGCVCCTQLLQSSLTLCNSVDCRDQWIGFKSCYRSVYFLCCMGTGTSWITESAWVFEFFIASVSRSHLTQSFFFPAVFYYL